MKCDGDPLRETPCNQQATNMRLLGWRFGRLKGTKPYNGCPYHWQLMGLHLDAPKHDRRAAIAHTREKAT
jgi:hypothetical protein